MGRSLVCTLLARNERRTSESNNDGVRWPESVKEEHRDSASVMISLTLDEDEADTSEGTRGFMFKLAQNHYFCLV